MSSICAHQLTKGWVSMNIASKNMHRLCIVSFRVEFGERNIAASFVFAEQILYNKHHTQIIVIRPSSKYSSTTFPSTLNNKS